MGATQMTNGLSQNMRVMDDVLARISGGRGASSLCHPASSAAPYRPSTGFDPCDGDDPRVTPPADCPIYGRGE